MNRRLDVVVYGAGGFTGRQTVRALARRADPVAWGVAGRRRSTLENVDGVATSTPCLVAALDDHAGLCDIASQTRVVVNLAGPYAPHAAGLIAACVETGTHYLDISGEIPLTRTLIDRFDAAARTAGVVVLPQCGYEAVPFDLLVASAHRAFRAADGSRLLEARVRAWFTYDVHPLRTGLGMSGGTLATTVAFGQPLDEGSLTDPSALLDRAPSHPAAPIDVSARRDPRTGHWLAPLAPSPFVNPAVVTRSAVLSDDRYADAFTYAERFDATASLGSIRGAPRLAATAFAGLTATLVRGSERRATRRDRVILGALRRFGPRPGSGPRERQLDRLGYAIELTARSDSGATATGSLSASGNAGYRSTPAILVEIAAALARGDIQRSGVLTPAAALGAGFLPALEPAGITARVDLHDRPAPVTMP